MRPRRVAPLQGLDFCISQTRPSESMVCYIPMIYLADGELEVLRASSQMGRQMFGRPPCNSLFILFARNFPTDSSTVFYMPMGMKYVFFPGPSSELNFFTPPSGTARSCLSLKKINTGKCGIEMKVKREIGEGR